MLGADRRAAWLSAWPAGTARCAAGSSFGESPHAGAPCVAAGRSSPSAVQGPPQGSARPSEDSERSGRPDP
eukprot:1471008-Alexandrium_andersonii.AAC.1